MFQLKSETQNEILSSKATVNTIQRKRVRNSKSTSFLPVRSSNTRYENIEETMIEMDVANTLRILSAYFTATATIRPPKA